MSKKCLVCGAPIDGFFARIAALAGVKPSEKNPDYCNKCEAHIPAAVLPPEEKPEEPKDLYEAAEESKEVTSVTPEPVAPATPTEPPSSATEPPKPAEPEIKLNTEEPKDMFAETDKKV